MGKYTTRLIDNDYRLFHPDGTCIADCMLCPSATAIENELNALKSKLDAQQATIDLCRERENKLVEAMMNERNELAVRINGKTHWAGCELDHLTCAALKRIDAVLAATHPPADEGKAGV